MDTPIATCVDDICGGGGDVMVVTTDEDDLFLGVDRESRELCFSWAAVYGLRTIIVSDGDRTVLPSTPSKNEEQISRAKNTRPLTKVYNCNDLISPSRPTVAISHPSNDDRGRVRRDINTSDISVHNAKSFEELGNRMNADQMTVVAGEKGHIMTQTKQEMFNNLVGHSNAMPPTDKGRGLVRVEIEREQKLQDHVESIRAEPHVQPKERKKREWWTKDEQKLFLMGGMIFGRKWRKIRKYFVRTKSSSQFGSHVQKFRKRKVQPIAKRKRYTVNDITVDDITREDVVRLAPEEWRLPVLSAMAACSNGGETLVQQSPNAALQGNNSGCSAPTRRRPFVPVVQETVMNPSAPIVQPASSIAFASFNAGSTPVQPASSFASFADGRWTRLVQLSPRPHLGAAYLGYP